MLAKEIKPGSVVTYQEAPVLVQSVTVQTPSARGASTLYKFRGRHLVTRQKIDFTLKGTESLEAADFQYRPVKMMYADDTFVHFLDQEDFNQYEVGRADIQEEMAYVTEELDGVMALIYQDHCVGVKLPTAVNLRVVHCDPGVRGNSATGRTKPAVLETGLVVQVPEYLNQGETIRVDTRTGEFVSRG